MVVNYEAGDHLRRCVRALRAQGPDQIVVVDNGSSDGSARRLREDCPEVTVVEPGANLGYARAANLGTAACDGDVVMVCNPDVEVAPGAWDVVRGVFEREPDVAAVGPRVRNPDGSTYPSARRVPSTGVAVGHGALGLVWPANPCTRRYRELDADPLVARDVDWVSGAALWLRRSALDAVGGWDERFFMYAEDLELGWRLRGAGFRIRYEPAAVVTHVQGVSTAARADRMILEHHRSAYRFAEKRWHGARRALLAPAAAYLALRAGAAITARHLSSPRGAPGSASGDPGPQGDAG